MWKFKKLLTTRDRLVITIPTTKDLVILLYLNGKQGRLPLRPYLSVYQKNLSHALYMTTITICYNRSGEKIPIDIKASK